MLINSRLSPLVRSCSGMRHVQRRRANAVVLVGVTTHMCLPMSPREADPGFEVAADPEATGARAREESLLDGKAVRRAHLHGAAFEKQGSHSCLHGNPAQGCEQENTSLSPTS